MANMAGTNPCNTLQHTATHCTTNPCNTVQHTARQTPATGWRRLIGSPKLQVIFRKRATNNRALLWKLTYEDKGSYESSPPCKGTQYIRQVLSASIAPTSIFKLWVNWLSCGSCGSCHRQSYNHTFPHSYGPTANQLLPGAGRMFKAIWDRSGRFYFIFFIFTIWRCRLSPVGPRVAWHTNWYPFRSQDIALFPLYVCIVPFVCPNRCPAAFTHDRHNSLESRVTHDTHDPEYEDAE